MNTELQDIIRRLNEAKERRGRLAVIAAESRISTRTIYGLMHDETPKATARTIDKLADYFKKADKKLAKESA